MTLLERDETGEWPQIIFPEGPKSTGRRILAEVAGAHGLSVEAVTGERRFRRLSLCRQEAAWRIAAETKLSLPQIGRLLGKDHSTVLWAIRRHNEATGTNVRGMGGPPPEKIARNRASATRSKRPLTLSQKLRRSELRKAEQAGAGH